MIPANRMKVGTKIRSEDEHLGKIVYRDEKGFFIVRDDGSHYHLKKEDDQYVGFYEDK